MADLTTILIQYPVLETLCRHLRTGDFTALTQINTDYRLLLKGLQRPSPSLRPHVYKPVVRTCSCSTDHAACCPKHGTPTLRNLFNKVDHTCEDFGHTHLTCRHLSIDGIWMSTIFDALGGLSNVSSCRMCGISVCTRNWWRTNMSRARGNGRAQHACDTCWETDFEKLREDNTQRFSSSRIDYASWKEAQQNHAFCQCGPTILCSGCTETIRPRGIYVQRGSIIHRPSQPHPYSTWSYLNIFRPKLQYECAGCSCLLATSDRFPAHFFCQLCNLPMQMRNADHPIERQSKMIGTFRDDGNYETNRIGADYESVQQYWKATWITALGTYRDSSIFPPPPTNWEPVEFAWARFNAASRIPIEKRDSLAQLGRSSYFQPLRTPVWDFEKLLFEPPPRILTYNHWKIVIPGTYFSDYSIELMTYEQFRRRGCGWTDKMINNEKKEVAKYRATCRNGKAPLPKLAWYMWSQDKYFKPLERPVWDFEVAMFEDGGLENSGI